MSVYHQIIIAVVPLVSALDQFDIPYYIGGSVSSSVHGMYRRTQDVDVIADIQLNHVRVLARVLGNEYYLDEQAWADAVRHESLYNMIHLNTMMKVDLIPLKRSAFAREEVQRAQLQTLEEGMPPLKVASAEDSVLTKLVWFRMGGGTSERQWNDILEILRRQDNIIDLAYLHRWSGSLGVQDLLERVLGEAGLK